MALAKVAGVASAGSCLVEPSGSRTSISAALDMRSLFYACDFSAEAMRSSEKRGISAVSATIVSVRFFVA